MKPPVKKSNKPNSEHRLDNDVKLSRAAGVSYATIKSWKMRLDFPKERADGSIDPVVWAQYAKTRALAAEKAQTSKHGALDKLKVKKQVQMLEINLQKAKRDAFLHRVEFESKRGLWFSVDQVKEFASLVASAFEEAVLGVEMKTRDPELVKLTRLHFDSVRVKLAEKIENIKTLPPFEEEDENADNDDLLSEDA